MPAWAWLLFPALSLGAPSERWSAACSGSARFVKFHAEPRLELREALLPPGTEEREKVFAAAIQQQLKYLQKELKSQWERAGTMLTFREGEARVSGLRHRAVAAKASYEVARVEHPDVSIEAPYVAAAIGKGKLAAGQRARELRYVADWEGALCNAGATVPASNPTATVPRDPYLAFWIASPAERITLRWFGSSFTLSPAFENEYADIPHPEYGWYFWQPAAGAKFLRPGRNVERVRVRAEAGAELPAWRMAGGKDTLFRATVMFGIVSEYLPVWSLAQAFQNREGGGKDWEGVISRAEDFGAGRQLDTGSEYATGFLRRLGAVLDLSSSRYRFDPDHHLVTIEGKLADGGRPARLRLFFGHTDLLVQTPAEHWSLAVDALAEDDVVVYMGHSGLGENFKVENIEAKAGRPVVTRPGQLVAVLSCSSYAYFSGFPQSSGQLLLTGTSHVSADDVLQLLTGAGAAGRQPASALAPGHGEFLLIRSREGDDDGR